MSPTLLLLAGCIGCASVSTAADSTESSARVIFECADNGRTARLAAEGGDLILSIVGQDLNVVTVKSDADWGNLRLGHVVGQQGGHQSHLRLSDGPDDYLVFEGENGQLSDVSNRTYAGVVRFTRSATGEASETLVECSPASSQNREFTDAVTSASEASGRLPVRHEDDGSKFDGWF